MKGDGGGFFNFVAGESLDAKGQVNRYRFPFKHKTLGKNFYVDRISCKITNGETNPHKYFLTFAVPKDSNVLDPKDVVKYRYRDVEGKWVEVDLDEIGKPVDIPIDAIRLEVKEWHDPEGILKREDEFDWYAYEVELSGARILNFKDMEEEQKEEYEMCGYKDGDLVPKSKVFNLYIESDRGTYYEVGLWILGSFGGGTGILGDPYLIDTWTHLHNVRTELDKSFELTRDLETADADYLTYNDPATDGWLPIGDATTQFTGTFDGQGYEISGLYIDCPSTDFIGLFGYVDAGAEVSNVGMIDVDVLGGWPVGGVVGVNRGTVSNSYATGNVSGRLRVGGLVGLNNTGTVSNSYATGTVTRTSGTSAHFGGFAGQNHRGKIINCYSTGSVHYEGTTDPTNKGFAGYVDTGGAYEMTGNFWDMETSGQTSTAGDATGLSTADMQTLATFDTATWDIAGVADENTRNTDYIWNQVDGVTYPFLSWEEPEVPPPPTAPPAVRGKRNRFITVIR